MREVCQLIRGCALTLHGNGPGVEGSFDPKKPLPRRDGDGTTNLPRIGSAGLIEFETESYGTCQHKSTMRGSEEKEKILSTRNPELTLEVPDSKSWRLLRIGPRWR